MLFEGKGKTTVDNCDVRERFYPLREDVGRFAAGAYMLSVADAVTAPAQPNEALFALLYYALSYAAYGNKTQRTWPSASWPGAWPCRASP